ncbi:MULTISPECIES: PAS domain-containing protein [Kordiimonas]|jgi:hypothetical protein|uniref:PAS domain-containing protein n=1 Tax=Kordiimonas TaxID=288021 RepID=UPI0025798913|nr:PAS domain-containing protein [Kordiimonas sp. UBA4487]
MVESLRLEGRFKDFFDIWASFRREGQHVPDWEQVRPMAFGNLLPDVTLAQKHGPNDYRYRLLGSGINERMGQDPVGVDILSFLASDHRRYADAWLELAAAHPCALLHEASVEYQKVHHKSYQALNLPIRGGSGEIDTFIYYNLMQAPKLGEDTGELISVGKKAFVIKPVDIGAGVPDAPKPC